MARWAVYTAVLFAAWYFNLGGVPDGMVWARTTPRTGYLGNDSQLVLGRLAQADAHPLGPLVDVGAGGRSKPYRSQFGLTGVALARLRPLTGLGPADFAVAAGALFALLTAATLAAVFAAAHRTLGPPTGDVACALATSVPILLPFAPSLYWATFLLLAPFALVWCLLPRAATPRRAAALAAGVGLLVIAKALCGYEYITTVILAPVAAGWFHQHRAAAPLRARAGLAAALVAAGVAGFAAAMVLHAAQIRAVSGEDGFAVIRERAAARTTGDPAAEAGDRAGPAECFWAYFEQRALSLPASADLRRADVPLKAVALAALGLAAAALVARRRLPREAVGLAGAVAVALAAGVSWQALAVNHMCVHRHINQIVFAVPFLPVAFVAAGYALRLALGQGPAARWVGAAVTAGAAALMAANLALAVRDQRVGREEQARAEAAVAERLGGPGAPASSAVGAVDVARPAADVLPGLLLEVGLLDPATAGPADPGALVIQGWAVGDWAAGRRPTARVVVSVGGSVVGCEARRFSRPDLGLGPAVAGFVVAVPSAALRPGGAVRVFAVAAGEPDRVTEITPPGGICVPPRGGG